MKLNIKLCLLHVAGGSSMMKALKNVVTFFLLLAKQGSSEIAASITKSLTHSNRRDQQTCQSGFTFNTCANCCGYKFASKSDLSNAIGQYFYDKLAGKNSSDMNCWDVSSIHDMSTLFFEFNGRYSNAVYFDEPIGCWDVSSVTTMWSMFAYTHFNQSIGNWDVSKVTDMSGMFYGATKFNQDIGNWDVSKVVNMNGMFYQASSFNQTISNWNVSRVTNMHQMFLLATSFNQAVSNWNVSKVANMYQMFYYATNFNQDLCAWYNKLLSTTVVGSMFLGSGCTNKTAPDFLVMKSFCQACTCNESK
jgi:surface protein